MPASQLGEVEKDDNDNEIVAHNKKKEEKSNKYERRFVFVLKKVTITDNKEEEEEKRRQCGRALEKERKRLFTSLYIYIYIRYSLHIAFPPLEFI